MAATGKMGTDEVRRFALADGELAYREAGAGPPLLLIHGAGPDSASWRDTFWDLAEDHRVIAPDRAGYGHSRGLSLREGWHDHAEDIAGLIEAQDVVPVKVAALSGGGIVALDLAVNHPQLVSSLTLFEPPIYGKRHVTPSLIRVVLRAQAERRLRGARAAFEPYLRWVTKSRTGDSTWDQIPEQRREATLENADAGWKDFDSGDGGYLAPSDLASLAVPITIIYGADTQRWFEKCARGLAKVIPHARVETIEGATHAVTVSRPHELAGLIRSTA